MKISKNQKIVLFTSTATAFLVPELASAALPTAATDAFTTLIADGNSMIAKAWDVVVPITSGFVILKMFKRAANKA